MSPEPSATSRQVRAGRAVVGSAVAVIVALAAHLLGGGAAPSVLVVVAVALLVQPVAVLLVGRRPRLWRQAAVVGVGQLAAHAVFALGGAEAAATALGHHAMSVPVMPAHDGASMEIWHALAAIATIAAWRWGEAAWWRTVESAALVVRRLATAIAPVAAPQHVRPGPAASLPRPSRLLIVQAQDPLRGPPVSR